MTETRTNRSLLADVGEGDRMALRELYTRHAPWLMFRLRRRCPDRGMVEEVVQDTFVAIWRGARSYSGAGEVAAWMWGIAAFGWWRSSVTPGLLSWRVRGGRREGTS